MHRPVKLVALLLVVVLVRSASAQVPTGSAASSPTIDALISLKRVGTPALSPDGKWVAYTMRETNWEENSYETEIWLAEVAAGTLRQLTNARKSSSSPTWSPDGSMVAFVSDRSDKQQLYIIRVAGGEAGALTSMADGVSATFAWSPDSRHIAYTATDPVAEARKDRDKKYGEFEIVDADHRLSHLWVIDLAAKTPRRLTSGAFTVGTIDWSPDGKVIAFDHRLNADPSNGNTADISVVSVGDGSIRALVTLGGPDTRPWWSPDGTQIAFESAMGSATHYSNKNRYVAVVSAGGGAPSNVSSVFDEVPSLVAWKRNGIYFSASARTWAYLYRLDPQTKAATRVAPGTEWIMAGVSLSADASSVAFMGSGPKQFPEVFVAPVATMAAKKLTDTSAQVASWPQQTPELITWKSKDGTAIEGVLHKPANFQTGSRYPLLVVIHGGPTAISRPVPFASTSIYPIDAFLNKGALVLEPNYRGSAGYGETFRSLNVRNLGIGDAWDVVSGIDHLVAQGLVDNDNVGAMGWSQGGYISAFLTTHDSARFRAVSVGAGISNWMTYYVNTDIHPFTRMYLGATPWDDPKIYADTSPMTYIKQAKAPTLIQHGATDQRVPLPNAFELYQGLQDVGVPVTFLIYKGFEGIGHGPSKPKSSRALMEHNLGWFSKYIWGEEPTSTNSAIKPR